VIESRVSVGNFALGVATSGVPLPPWQADSDGPVFTRSFWRDTSLHAEFLRNLNIDLTPTQTLHANADEPCAVQRSITFLPTRV